MSAIASCVGEVGFTIEFGRPGVGVWFHEIQKMCTALARAGVAFEKKNPITSLMSDVPTGTIREDILNEKIMSAIVEIKVPVDRTEQIIRLVWEIEKQVNTVVAIGVGTRCDEQGEENVVAPILERLGYKLERAKTNIGLGRITNPDAKQTERTPSDAVMEEVKSLAEPAAGPDLRRSIYLDALYVKMRHEGRVENRAVYVAIGIDLEGQKDVLGLWTQRQRRRQVLAGRADGAEESRREGHADRLRGWAEGIPASD